MLVLTRHRGEQIVIADDIIVTVVGVEGGKVRLGIVAPPSIRVDRKEVHDRRLADGNRASLERKKRGAAAPLVGAGTND